MRLAVLGLLLLFAAPPKMEKFPIEKVIKNAEEVARTKSKTGTFAVVGRLYALQFEGWSEVDAPAGTTPANAPESDPSLRIAPLKGGIAARRTRAIEAYRRSVELEASNAAAWLALGWLYRSGDKPDDKLALQSYKKVERLIQSPRNDFEKSILLRALEALEQLQPDDADARAAIAQRRQALQ